MQLYPTRHKGYAPLFWLFALAVVMLGRVPWTVEGWVSEPDSDGRDVDGAFVDELSFVVAGGHGAGAAELVEGPLDGVASLVGPLGRILVGWFGDRGLDSSAAQRSTQRGWR